MNNNIAMYQSGEIEIEVSVDDETVWLNRQQLSELFARDVKTIGKHIANVFKDKELEKIAVVSKFATTASDVLPLFQTSPLKITQPFDILVS